MSLMDGEQMKTAREQLGLTQQALGLLLGLSSTGRNASARVGEWERNLVPIPDDVADLTAALAAHHTKTKA
jgi:transcriptional regulator with XRE-family HTH domain